MASRYEGGESGPLCLGGYAEVIIGAEVRDSVRPVETAAVKLEDAEPLSLNSLSTGDGVCLVQGEAPRSGAIGEGDELC